MKHKPDMAPEPIAATSRQASQQTNKSNAEKVSGKQTGLTLHTCRTSFD